MNDIRVNYVGVVSFFSNLALLIGGLFFSVMITRLLDPEDFGFWVLISGMISYILIIEPVSSYWITRKVSRGQSLQNGIVNSIILSGGFNHISWFNIICKCHHDIENVYLMKLFVYCSNIYL